MAFLAFVLRLTVSTVLYLLASIPIILAASAVSIASLITSFVTLSVKATFRYVRYVRGDWNAFLLATGRKTMPTASSSKTATEETENVVPFSGEH
jgi:hypothetical protein